MRSCKAVRHRIRGGTIGARKAKAPTRAAVQLAQGKRAQVKCAAAPCALLPIPGQTNAMTNLADSESSRAKVSNLAAALWDQRATLVPEQGYTNA